MELECYQLPTSIEIKTRGRHFNNLSDISKISEAKNVMIQYPIRIDYDVASHGTGQSELHLSSLDFRRFQ